MTNAATIEAPSLLLPSVIPPASTELCPVAWPRRLVLFAGEKEFQAVIDEMSAILTPVQW